MALISLFVHDLSLTPIGRAYPIARSLEKSGHSIEVLGLLIEDSEIYYPYRDLFKYRALRSKRNLPHMLFNTAKLAKMASGDIVYAFKPLWTSYWPALLASSFGKKKLLILDIEDEELLFCYDGMRDFIYKRLIRGWTSLLSWQYRVLLHPLTSLATKKTVVSSYLQSRYGGEILVHGPDEELFDPYRDGLDSKLCREKWNLPADSPIAIFVGNPHEHKGLHILVNALELKQASNIHLVLGGDINHSQFQSAKTILKSRCHLIGYVPNSQIPEIMVAADVVPIPQLDTVFSRAQIPAKLLEAMAMSKPIIASNVSDLPHILGAGSSSPRGWIVDPGNSNELASTLEYVLSNPDEAVQRGKLAREYYLQNASTFALGEKLAKIINPDII